MFVIQYSLGVHTSMLSGLEVLLVVLKRMAYPSRYVDLQEFFKRPKCELIQLFNLGLDHIMANFGDKLTNLEQPWLTLAKLQEYCQAITARGAPIHRCWGFIDGTVRQTCRPGRNQKLVYSGHKRFHGLKFQSVVTPNGLIANLYGPMPGRRHDSALLTASGLMDHMEANFNLPDGTALCLYGDPAYPRRPHLERPHRGNQLTEQQQDENTAMSGVRQAVEWQFGKVVALWAFLDFHKNLKLFLSPVAKMYKLGALLTNCHCCLEGNQVSQYFRVLPPTLEEYLS